MSVTSKDRAFSPKISVIAPDLSGGGVTRVYFLCQLLRACHYDIEVVGCQFGSQIYPPPPPGLSVIAAPGRPFPGFLGTILQLLPKLQGDILYAVKPRLTSFGLALLKKRLGHRPIILDIDDWELSWMGDPYQPTLRQWVRDIVKPDGALRDVNHRAYLEWLETQVPQADAVTVTTRFLGDRFGGHYLPNGRDTDLFDPARFEGDRCRQRYGLSAYRVLMFPGTVRPHKGLEDVLQALEILDLPDLRLVIAGGRKPDRYEDDLMEQWGKWLIKLPQVPVEAMPEVVAAAHVVVVPQRETPTAKAQFPLKLTDGMAMAKPILATQVGDIPEILGGAGYLVQPQAPQALADQIQFIFDHYDQAIAQGKRARAQCINHYSIRAMGNTLDAIIQNLAGNTSFKKQ